MRFGTGHAIIMTTVLVSVIVTFLAANAITGFRVAGEGIGKGGFAEITGQAMGETGGIGNFQALAGSVLAALAAITALVIVARIGQNSIARARENAAPDINYTVNMAEEAIQEGNHTAAYALYSEVREQYAKLAEQEKARHYARIMKIHGQLAQQAAIMEAQHLTDKYVNGTITQQEFERLKMLVTGQ